MLKACITRQAGPGLETGGFRMIGFDNLSGFVTFFPGPLSSSCDYINVNHFKSSTLWLTKLSIVNSELI